MKKQFDFHSSHEQKIARKKALDDYVDGGMNNADVVRTLILDMAYNEGIDREDAKKLTLIVIMLGEVNGQISDGEFENFNGEQAQHLYKERDGVIDGEIIEDYWTLDWQIVTDAVQRMYYADKYDTKDLTASYIVDKYIELWDKKYRRLLDFDDNFVESLLKEIYPSDWKWLVTEIMDNASVDDYNDEIYDEEDYDDRDEEDYDDEIYEEED